LSTFTFFDEFINNLGNGAIDLDSDTFRAALTNSAPDAAAHDELADITQIATGFGYTQAADGAGEALTSVTWVETGGGTGIWQWSAADITWTASGGDIGPFRYVVICSDTSTNNKLVGYLDHGEAVTILDGNSYTVDVGANGFFQAQEA
jgi:hypothetical protein